MAFYLGVDTGATKSIALIADENGRLRGVGRAGPGNWEVVGWKQTSRVLQAIITQAADEAGIQVSQIDGAGFGLAGYDWPEDYQPHAEIIRNFLPDVPFSLVNDAFIGLWAGSEAGWGVVVSAGTSCNCYGRDRAGNIGRVTGSNYRFGENAGAGAIVARAVQAVAKAWTQRAPQTALTELFCQETGTAEVTDLLAGLVRSRYELTAKHAPLVFKAAEQGDAVSQEIIRWAGEGLGDLAIGVIRQLKLQGEAFDVVLSGGTFSGSPRLQEVMDEVICGEAPSARLERLTVPPVTGAVILGLEQAGQATAAARRQLLSEAENIFPLT